MSENVHHPTIVSITWERFVWFQLGGHHSKAKVILFQLNKESGGYILSYGCRRKTTTDQFLWRQLYMTLSGHFWSKFSNKLFFNFSRWNISFRVILDWQEPIFYDTIGLRPRQRKKSWFCLRPMCFSIDFMNFTFQNNLETISLITDSELHKAHIYQWVSTLKIKKNDKIPAQ